MSRVILNRIGKFELRGVLGAGATSTVYLGFDRFAQREVAIKKIAPHILDDSGRGRLYRHLLINEASLAGKLVHPHIVQIFDAVVEADEGYIVMEYVAGGTLEQYCSTEFLLPMERVVEIIFKCTRALDFAYRQGVTHRDIKPANILMGDDGQVKVSDFGAALLSSNERTQVSGVGSPAYMSPQQVRELPLNHQTDIWSLGVVLYQVLTGRLPFQATNNYGMVFQICSVEPPPPSLFRRDLPASIDTVVARAMNKRIDERYQSWDEFSHDLAQAFRARQLREREPAFADSEKFETLRALAFFAEFSDVELWEVLRFSTWERFPAGAFIMRDGDQGDYFCILAEGEVRVMKKNRVLSTLLVGECFGEMAVINAAAGTRGASVVANVAAKIISIPGAALRQASEACRMHFYASFLRVLSARLGAANARLAAV